jgi:transposase
MYSRSDPRRRHSAELKAKVLADCDMPGASISGVALAHGLNANLVRQWRAGRGVKLAGMPVTPPAASQALKAAEAHAPTLASATAEFIAIEMPTPSKTAAAPAKVAPTATAPSADPMIEVELRRGPLHLNVRWPTAAADNCRAWLSELSCGLLK